MNKDILEGHWNEIKGKLKEHFGKLTDDEITQIQGKRDRFIGKLQAKYGYAREKAEDELNKFLRTCKIEETSTSANREKAFSSSGGVNKAGGRGQEDRSSQGRSSQERSSQDRSSQKTNKPHNDNW